MQSLTGRVVVALLTAFGVLSVLAVTLGLINVARAGAVSVLPVTSQQTGIAVCGHGTAQVKPDRATITLGVTATSSSAEGARNQAAGAMTAVLNALKQNGVKNEDIQTGYISLNPVYDYSGGSSRITGYAAANSVTALIRGVDSAGKVMDAATRAGGNNVFVNGISFSAGDPSAAVSQAQKNAIADAKTQAARIAENSGVSLGTPVSIQVGGCGQPQRGPVYYDGTAQATSGGKTTTPVEPGQQEVVADVAVVYSIR